MKITERLRQELKNLQEWQQYLSRTNKSDLQVLVKAAGISKSILETIKLASEKPYNEEVINFIEAINPIIENLCIVAKDMSDESLPSKSFLSDLTEAFSRFVNQYASKPVLKTMRKISEYVPYVNSIIDCCETIPRYWDAASRNEKIAIALGITLLLTSVALTVAFYASPVLAAIPLLGLAIAGISAIASVCYQQALISPKNIEKKKTDAKNVLHAVQQQKIMVAEILASPMVKTKASKIKLD
jgi:hypothetical protein